MIYKQLFGLLFLFANSSMVLAEPAPARLTPEQIAPLQRLYELNKALDVKGIPPIRLVSFAASGKDVAITKIEGKTARENSIYMMGVGEGRPGEAFISIRLFQDCVITGDDVPMLQQTIQVDGQAVEVFVVCTITGTDGAKQLAFVPHSAPGKQVIYEAFMARPFVFMTLQGVEVPFKAEGFEHVWKKAKVSAR